MSDSTSQPSSRTAKSGKFALLSSAIKHSDIHLEVLFFQSRKSFEYFFCFHRPLGISPKDLEGFKADIAFIYTTLAYHNCLEFSQPLVFISGYANTENVFYSVK